MHDPGEHVAAGPVGAEPVVGAGGPGGDAGGERVLGEQGSEHRAQHHHQEDPEGDPGGQGQPAQAGAGPGEPPGEGAWSEHHTVLMRGLTSR